MLAGVRQKMAVAKPQPDPGKATSNLISKIIRWQQLRDLELCRAIKPFPNYRLGGNAPYSKHQTRFTDTNILQLLYRTDIACVALQYPRLLPLHIPWHCESGYISNTTVPFRAHPYGENNWNDFLSCQISQKMAG
jgi:hypothetical protein